MDNYIENQTKVLNYELYLLKLEVILFGAACSPVTDQIVKAARHWNLVQVSQILIQHYPRLKYLSWLISLIIYTPPPLLPRDFTPSSSFLLIKGYVRGHSSHVHCSELPSLLQSSSLREWIQWASTGTAEAIQLDQSGNTLPKPTQIFSGKTLTDEMDGWW